MKIRSEKTKKLFIKYMQQHPEERFWQSVRNFSGYPFIIGSNRSPDDLDIDSKDQQDTFYIEEM